MIDTQKSSKFTSMLKSYPKLSCKPDNRPDEKAWDGHFHMGWRKVRPGGIVKATGTWYKNEERLSELVGFWVLFTMSDYWGQTGHIVYNGEFYCEVKAYADPRNK